jgi:hypothetical protein
MVEKKGKWDIRSTVVMVILQVVCKCMQNPLELVRMVKNVCLQNAR